MPTLTITEACFEERNGDQFWLGPLGLGKQLVAQDRFIIEGVQPDGSYRVSLCDDPEGNEEAEWGSSAAGDAEEAWRFALGAAIGPYDYDTDEHTIEWGLS